MSDPSFTDEELMAYADGELADDRAGELDLILATDAQLAGRLARFTETRVAVSKAYRAMLDEPVPDQLVQHVRDLAKSPPGGQTKPASEPDVAPDRARDKVVAMHPKPAGSPPSRRSFWPMPLAASVALAIGIGTGVLLSGDGGGGDVLQVSLPAGPSIARALTSAPSGTSQRLTGGNKIAAISTFRDSSNALCREFEYARAGGGAVLSVACYDGKGWDVRLAIASTPAGGTGYVPASSPETLDAFLATIGAQAPLSLADEAKSLARLR